MHGGNEPDWGGAKTEPEYCYLTTTGRVSGKPHEIEIWYVRLGDVLYLLSGGGEKSDWVKNLRKDANVSLRIGEVTYAARARVLEPGDAADPTARKLLFDRYS